MGFWTNCYKRLGISKTLLSLNITFAFVSTSPSLLARWLESYDGIPFLDMPRWSLSGLAIPV